MFKKSNILVLGITGLLGNQMYRWFKNAGYTVRGTTRMKFEEICSFDFFDKDKVYESVDLFNINNIYNIIKENSPCVVINCVGITSHITSSISDKIYINSLIPHKLADICKKNGSIFVQISTDCVFSGNCGNYREYDFADASDDYGITKRMGEIKDIDNHIVIRTSFIGHELFHKRGLLEWFISQSDQVDGYSEVFWNGISTIQVAKTIELMLKRGITGLYNIGGERISKYELLMMVKKIYKKDTNIRKSSVIKSDKTLNLEKFKKLNIEIPSLESMLVELKENSIYAT